MICTVTVWGFLVSSKHIVVVTASVEFKYNAENSVSAEDTMTFLLFLIRHKQVH